jgi:HlyD family secretion protein
LNDLQGPVVQQTLRQAQASLDAARASGQRSLALFEQGFIGQAALDESRKALALADAQVLAAQKQVASTQAGGAEHSLAVGAVAEAQANAEAVSAKARYAVIKPPVSGQLIGRSVEVGDVVQAGKVLMTLSPEGATQLVVQIDEKNLRLIALGQQALASADAYPQQKFKAQVAYINPGINAQTGAVEVKLDVSEPVQTLRQDMTVSVDLAGGTQAAGVGACRWGRSTTSTGPRLGCGCEMRAMRCAARCGWACAVARGWRCWTACARATP